MTNCAEFRVPIQEVVAKSLPEEEALAVLQHCVKCDACMRFLSQTKLVEDSMLQYGRKVVVPQNLQNMVFDFEKNEIREPSRFNEIVSFAGCAAMAAAAAVVVTYLVYPALPWSVPQFSPDSITNALQNSVTDSVDKVMNNLKGD